MAGEGFAKWLRGLPNQPPFSVDRSATPTRIKDHPCLMATPPVAWPKRSAAGICHDHPECRADAVMAARCRGFSDACVRGVAPPEWDSEPEDLVEALQALYRPARKPTHALVSVEEYRRQLGEVLDVIDSPHHP